jgi:predicted nucleic acid-binding protein
VTPLVVDSSVAYKWLSHVDEDHVEEALSLLAEHRAGVLLLVAPSLLHVELANALVGSRHVSQEAALEIIEGLEALHVELIPGTPARLRAAALLSYHHQLSIYDALFLQLAEELDCPLVTADRKAFAGVDSPAEIRLL